MKKKSIKKMKITKTFMREQGFTDGYTDEKSKEDLWIKRLYNLNKNTNIIKEYIESYRIGYKVGKYTSFDLENASVKNGEIYYNNEMINEKVSGNEIKQKIKSLTKKNKKEGK